MSTRVALHQLSNNVFCIKADGSLEPDTLDCEEVKKVAGRYLSSRLKLLLIRLRPNEQKSGS